jgi:hypothetical protein
MLYGELPEVTLPSGEKARGIRVSVPNPPKIAFLGLPTNEQMLERLNQQKPILRRSLGRGKSKTEYTPNTKADMDLFSRIRLDKDGPEFDEYEAADTLARLASAEVIDCQNQGNQYVVTIKTPFGEAKHTLGGPMRRDLAQYRSSVVDSVDLPRGVEELRHRVAPAVALYDAVVLKIEGYAAEYTAANIPPHHKSAVVAELVQALEEIDISLDPNS